MTPQFNDEARAIIKRGEGSVAHMYLDTVGKVTVGVGNMLASAEAACELPFVHSDTLAAADDPQIIDEYRLLQQQPSGLKASRYRQYTQLILTGGEIDVLLDQRIAGFVKQLQTDFPGYEDYPLPAQLGLLDMAFNLGNHGLISKFPTFTRAARNKDWATCENECQRRGIADWRNSEVKALFQQSTLAS
jgi:GH24 family phage-related lysozyme (muramidase)